MHGARTVTTCQHATLRRPNRALHLVSKCSVCFGNPVQKAPCQPELDRNLNGVVGRYGDGQALRMDQSADFSTRGPSTQELEASVELCQWLTTVLDFMTRRYAKAKWYVLC